MALPLIEQRLQLTPERPRVYMMKDVRGTKGSGGKVSLPRHRVRPHAFRRDTPPLVTRPRAGVRDDLEVVEHHRLGEGGRGGGAGGKGFAFN